MIQITQESFSLLKTSLSFPQRQTKLLYKSSFKGSLDELKVKIISFPKKNFFISLHRRNYSDSENYCL